MQNLLNSSHEIDLWRMSIEDWFEQNGREYPWRQTRDPYAILVSELMLQQTRIRTVLEKKYFENWMQQFPDTASLSTADDESILAAWQGLGYYNRARNLRKAALWIEQNLDGRFPRQPEVIRQLPGVGPYTAGAVASFAFDHPAVIVDGNIQRVLCRVFDYRQPIDQTEAVRQIWQWAEKLTPDSGARRYNSGIMEIGQTVCTRGTPDCPACPIAGWCRSCGSEKARDLPVKAKKTIITHRKEQVVLIVQKNKILLEKEAGSRRKGLWKLPGLPSNYAAEVKLLTSFDYAITRYRVTLLVYCAGAENPPTPLPEGIETQWFDLAGSLPPLGAPYLKAINKTSGKQNLAKE